MVAQLTERQQKYLDFIKEYIDENESAPQLKEIAQHFYVTSPTAHTVLEELQENGQLYFDRSETLGYYIRLPEWHTSGQQMVEISQIGFVNQYGMLYKFPTQMGHFASLRMNSQNGELFALKMAADIPQADLVVHDQLICERDLSPSIGDICIIPFGSKQYFLVQIIEVGPGDGQRKETQYSWNFIVYNENTHDYFAGLAEDQGWVLEYIPESLILATVTWMQRHPTH